MLSIFILITKAQKTPFETHADKNYTAIYAEIISYYQKLVKGKDQVKLFNYGTTDVGKP